MNAMSSCQHFLCTQIGRVGNAETSGEGTTEQTQKDKERKRGHKNNQNSNKREGEGMQKQRGRGRGNPRGQELAKKNHLLLALQQP